MLVAQGKGNSAVCSCMGLILKERMRGSPNSNRLNKWLYVLVVGAHTRFIWTHRGFAPNSRFTGRLVLPFILFGTGDFVLSGSLLLAYCGGGLWIHFGLPRLHQRVICVCE